MAQERKYPVGKQDFPKLREEGYLYVDKTELMFRMTHSNYEHVPPALSNLGSA